MLYATASAFRFVGPVGKALNGERRNGRDRLALGDQFCNDQANHRTELKPMSGKSEGMNKMRRGRRETHDRNVIRHLTIHAAPGTDDLSSGERRHNIDCARHAAKGFLGLRPRLAALNIAPPLATSSRSRT
jgi:hypothetical protein